jgi:putative PIN family toxin of toxin-antitoxin system
MNTASAGKLRVVLDSNVYVSAFLNERGNPFRIWCAALEGPYDLIISPPMVDGLGGVLRAVLAWGDARVTVQMKLVTRVARIIVPHTTLGEITWDDDNRILECAVAGKADLIVSGDRHLADLKHFRGNGIVRPADFTGS